MQKTLELPDKESVVKIFGPRDCYLRQIRDAFDVQVVARGQQIRLTGSQNEVKQCWMTLRELRRRVQRGEQLSQRKVANLIEESHLFDDTKDKNRRPLESFEGGHAPHPRTEGQARYIQDILNHDVVFCIGPAGTGKTYLAVAVALDYLKRGELSRIVLCRPAVEAGEHLGFLPGDLESKVNPYLRPLYDSLHDLMSPSTVREYVDSELIEILPLAFVRGRTLDDAFIILDEAQNCTVGQMKTFLTRLGTHAKLVVTGDITQVDLPREERSGLVDVQGRLQGIRGIHFSHLSEADIVRHRLVRDIVTAYQRESGPEL